jgi:prolyl-tRNA synthetase
MRWTKTLIPTLKEIPQDTESVSHQLLLRSGLVRMLMAGVYTYLPLGLRVLKNIEAIIRQEMASCQASELLLPALQPLEIWQRSGRDKDMGEVMIRFQDRRGRKVCLGPTHEEIITELVKNHLSSYKQLPLVLYQIQTKFRDEIRPRFGLVRACEFIMKDAYSFDADEAGLDKNYQAMFEAYKRIFERCGLDILITAADPGVMGGNESHEYMAPAREGEDILLSCAVCRQHRPFKEGEKEGCPSCGKPMEHVSAIEIGHIFKLGVKYSASLGAQFLDAKGTLKPVIMGCYGIGVSRLISTIVAQNSDKDGIIWPKEVAPYKVHILALDVEDPGLMNAAISVYEELENKGVATLLDDRKESSGSKFKDADLMGIPLQVTFGKQSMQKGLLEMKFRLNHTKIMKPREEVIKEIEGFLHG